MEHAPGLSSKRLVPDIGMNISQGLNDIQSSNRDTVIHWCQTRAG
jgi:hypothetical protein